MVGAKGMLRPKTTKHGKRKLIGTTMLRWGCRVVVGSLGRSMDWVSLSDMLHALESEINIDQRQIYLILLVSLCIFLSHMVLSHVFSPSWNSNFQQRQVGVGQVPQNLQQPRAGSVPPIGAAVAPLQWNLEFGRRRNARCFTVGLTDSCKIKNGW